MDYANALRQSMESRSLSQVDAARQTGLSTGTISRILAGKTAKLNISTLGKLKRGVPGFADLLQGEASAVAV